MRLMLLIPSLLFAAAGRGRSCLLRRPSLPSPRASSCGPSTRSSSTPTPSTPPATTRARRRRWPRACSRGLSRDDVEVAEAAPNKAQLVVRYRGTGRAQAPSAPGASRRGGGPREDWTIDPFTLLEKDGYFYGRGTSDDKAQAAVWVANLIRYRREGFRPDRDLIVALTADEEGGGPTTAWTGC